MLLAQLESPGTVLAFISLVLVGLGHLIAFVVLFTSLRNAVTQLDKTCARIEHSMALETNAIKQQIKDESDVLTKRQEKHSDTFSDLYKRADQLDKKVAVLEERSQHNTRQITENQTTQNSVNQAHRPASQS